eukprot:TRINITY_DN82208_c0_g1_i1.p1 TRINITY_DN82208_c0_g1~~TRINITY_DN82208_c0_g1_i1.p1  ORF type:complete len:472 (-),score=148.97 TRINITY_DN82208_c0_g1_i1:130-1545(-)
MADPKLDPVVKDDIGGDKMTESFLPAGEKSEGAKAAASVQGEGDYGTILEEGLRLRKFYVRLLGVTFCVLLLLMELILSVSLEACEQPLHAWLQTDAVLWILSLLSLGATSHYLKPIALRHLAKIDAAKAQRASTDDLEIMTVEVENKRKKIGAGLSIAAGLFLFAGFVAAVGAFFQLLLSFKGCDFTMFLVCSIFVSLRALAFGASLHIMKKVVIPYLELEGYVQEDDSFKKFATRMLNNGRVPGTEANVVMNANVLVHETLYEECGTHEMAEKGWMGRVLRIMEDGDALIYFDNPVEVERRIHKKDFGMLRVSSGTPPPEMVFQSVLSAQRIQAKAKMKAQAARANLVEKAASLKKKAAVKKGGDNAADETANPQAAQSPTSLGAAVVGASDATEAVAPAEPGTEAASKTAAEGDASVAVEIVDEPLPTNEALPANTEVPSTEAAPTSDAAAAGGGEPAVATNEERATE